MLLKLKSSLLLAILSILLYSCEKEYSLEGSKVGGTSVFTYTGAPGACINPVVTGAYVIGTALGATNTVTIAVDVTVPGTYTVSTATLNGISFTGSGTFTTIGAQTIVLTGSGTPVAAGIFSYTPGTAGCSFDVTVSGIDFLKCTIDGVARTFNVNLVGERTDTTFTIDGDESNAADPKIFEVHIAKPTGVTTGTYDKLSITNIDTFCIAGYKDATGPNDVWLTGLAVASAGFTVNITSFTTNRIEGTFSGSIYNDPILGTGEKVITAGQFSVPY